MTPKEYLDNIRNADREIDSKTRVLSKMKSQLYSIQSAQIRENVVQGGVKVTNEDRILRALEYEKKLIDELMNLFELKEDAREIIEQLNREVDRTLLTERYLNNNKWSEVSDFMDYEERYTKRLHNDALREFAKVWENRH